MNFKINTVVEICVKNSNLVSLVAVAMQTQMIFIGCGKLESAELVDSCVQLSKWSRASSQVIGVPVPVPVVRRTPAVDPGRGHRRG